MVRLKAKRKKSSVAPQALPTSIKAPFQWAGGKVRQIAIIREYFPTSFNGRYVEPFLGAGTVLLDRLQAWDGMGVEFIAADLNDALINFWVCVQQRPHELMQKLHGVEFQNFACRSDALRKAAFINLRERFNTIQKQREVKEPVVVDATRHVDPYFAALFLYLIRCSFKAIWRITKDGRLTSGPGSPLRQILDPTQIMALHAILNRNSVQFMLMDFSKTIDFARQGDIIYCDPPYANDKGVSAGYIARQEKYADVIFQTHVRDSCAAMSARGVAVLVSNSNAPIVQELFQTWHSQLIIVRARMANTCGEQNNEIIIYNEVAHQLRHPDKGDPQNFDSNG